MHKAYYLKSLKPLIFNMLLQFSLKSLNSFIVCKNENCFFINALKRSLLFRIIVSKKENNNQILKSRPVITKTSKTIAKQQTYALYLPYFTKIICCRQ
ncbi:hypothetical protein EGI16_10180 [Chryseobacterium sp. G0240]|nr:hypothetical protein EGI16_10180 [Chryseobacterium sp. G0240]